MELLVEIGVALLVAVWILVYLMRDQGTVPRQTHEESRGRITVTFKTYDPDEYKAEDEVREKWLKQQYPEGDKWIFTKVVGVSYRNNDGSDRRTIIRHCRVPAELQLVPEPNNPFDSNAIGVRRANGEPLGYLNQRLAADMHRWIGNGQHWVAVLTGIMGNDAKRVGAILALVRKKVAAETDKQVSTS
jgi:hypothetical protein